MSLTPHSRLTKIRKAAMLAPPITQTWWSLEFRHRHHVLAMPFKHKQTNKKTPSAWLRQGKMLILQGIRVRTYTCCTQEGAQELNHYWIPFCIKFYMCSLKTSGSCTGIILTIMRASRAVLRLTAVFITELWHLDWLCEHVQQWRCNNLTDIMSVFSCVCNRIKVW